MAKFGDDVIGEILSYLPVKSLLRFRCVSKSWSALIQSQFFVNQHVNHSIQSKTNQSLIIESFHRDHLRSLSLYPLNQALELRNPNYPDTKRLVGSCNGLLCLYNDDFDNIIIIIWNPATRKHVKLPEPLIKYNSFDDYKGLYVGSGFGYDSVSDDYKVVMLVEIRSRIEANVYSLRSNSWRKTLAFEGFHLYVGFACGALANKVSGVFTCGALHWIMWIHNAAVVVAFDLMTEESKTVALPDCSAGNAPHWCLSELGGCLSIVCSYMNGFFDVWVMKDYGVRESWTKLLNVNDIERIDFMIPLAFSESGDDVLMMVNSERFIWYNLEKKEAKFALPSSISHRRPMICLESLVSLGYKAKNDSNQRWRNGEKKGKTRAV